MGAIKEQLDRTLDRLTVIGRVFHAADQADPRAGETFLTDEELWAIAYANVPALFRNADLNVFRSQLTDDDRVGLDELLEQVRIAYHDGRNGD